MLENLGIVQLEAWDAPATNLEQTIALARRRLGGVTLLEWVARRVTDAELLDGAIVLLPGDENGPAASLASLVPPDVPVCFAQGRVPLTQLARAITAYPCRGVVTVGVDRRLVDPHMIDQLVTASCEGRAADFISFQAAGCSSNDFPRWCRTDALARLAMQMSMNQESLRPREHDLAEFEHHWIKLVARDDRPETAAVPADEDNWEEAETIFEHRGHECFDGQWVADRPLGVPRPAGRTAHTMTVAGSPE